MESNQKKKKMFKLNLFSFLLFISTPFSQQFMDWFIVAIIFSRYAPEITKEQYHPYLLAAVCYKCFTEDYLD